MKNNKGFLVYELIIAFSLTSIIGLSLVSTTFLLKNKSDKVSIETLLIVNKTLLMNNIRKDIINDGLINIKACEDDSNAIIANCAVFNYALSGEKKLIIDKENSIIEYGDYVKKYENVDLGETASINVTTIENVIEGYSDSFLQINIPIISTQLEEDYGISFIHTFDSRLNTFESFEF